MSAGPYARVYFSIWTDPRFEEIIVDDALLGAWTRLLLLAEAAWPQSVAVPRSLPESSLDALVKAGVIELHPADTYRIHGLDPERERRSLHGQKAAQRRWDAPGNAPGNPQRNAQSMLAPMTSTSSSIEIPLRGNDGEELTLGDPVVTYFELTTRYPKGNALAWVKRLGDVYGFGHASSSMRSAWLDSDEIGTLLSRTEDRLVASERAAELREKAEEKERLRQKRATRRVIVDPGPEKVGAIMGDIRKALGR